MTAATDPDIIKRVECLRNTHKWAVACLLLLVLGLQAQATFACEVADHTGVLQQCCCMDDSHVADALPIPGDGDCCQYNHNLVIKGSDPAEKKPPIALGKSLELDLPSPAVDFLATLIDHLRPAAVSSRIHVTQSPAAPGTRTYLTTLRLRI